MRGKVYIIVHTVAIVGITPAYAGKSSVADKTFTPQRDHPRLCGEKCGFSRIPAAVKGSPPPMRGKGTKCVKINHNLRITPAYAGKSSTILFFTNCL